MNSQNEELEKKENIEFIPNEEISEEENSENADQEEVPGSNVNLASFITTPYERVLSIINEAKAFILSVSKDQQELIKGLEWSIKVISSHSLYSYEIKDQDYLNQMSEENPDFKQFVEFVNSYNDKVIQINENNMIEGKSFQKSSLNLKRPNPSLKIEKEEKKETKIEDNNNNNESYIKIKLNKEEKNHENTRNNSKFFSPKSKDNSLLIKSKNKSFSKLEKHNKKTRNHPIKLIKNLKFNTNQKLVNKSNSVVRNQSVKSPQPKKRVNRKTINRLNNDNNKLDKNLSGKDLKKISKIENDNMEDSFMLESPILNDLNYPTTRILEKSFNIFELKEIVGYNKVLPIMGKVILDAFGLDTPDIISTEKLEPFLESISNQYLETTLYHNSLHGADVTQSITLYFLNSNAEEVCKSLVLDLLGIIISALGHDIGHPGYTNPFHINSSSELAITYNDASCLENFHASKLFRTIRNPKTDIFEKLSVINYKTIRKRMIGNILATDMANHGKIMTVIKSRISINIAENKQRFELLSGNENTKFEEQQSLFDFLLHSADLAHNTKLFNISLKWVELLSEEFWLQGDKEKSLKLPVSFLCDRESYNVPKSQVGFIKGFIIPTFECLVDIFPTLKYTLDNAKTNLNRWQKLANKGRLKGWTPDKTKQVNYKRKMILFNAISSFSENGIKKQLLKRKSGNVNSLSHELQVKEIKNENKEQKDKNENDDKKNTKNKVIRPNIINKTKNHDRKVHINKWQKQK